MRMLLIPSVAVMLAVSACSDNRPMTNQNAAYPSTADGSLKDGPHVDADGRDPRTGDVRHEEAREDRVMNNGVSGNGADNSMTRNGKTGGGAMDDKSSQRPNTNPNPAPIRSGEADGSLKDGPHVDADGRDPRTGDVRHEEAREDRVMNNGVSGNGADNSMTRNGKTGGGAMDDKSSQRPNPNPNPGPIRSGDNVENAVTPQRNADSVKESQTYQRDNSGRNLREDGSKPTPLDQGENDVDLGITQVIRSTLMKRDDLSMKAKNCKIITRDAMVTLRGPVEDVREQDAIGAVAKAQVGVRSVDNQLEPISR